MRQVYVTYWIYNGPRQGIAYTSTLIPDSKSAAYDVLISVLDWNGDAVGAPRLQPHDGSGGGHRWGVDQTIICSRGEVPPHSNIPSTSTYNQADPSITRKTVKEQTQIWRLKWNCKTLIMQCSMLTEIQSLWHLSQYCRCMSCFQTPSPPPHQSQCSRTGVSPQSLSSQCCKWESHHRRVRCCQCHQNHTHFLQTCDAMLCDGRSQSNEGNNGASIHNKLLLLWHYENL